MALYVGTHPVHVADILPGTALKSAWVDGEGWKLVDQAAPPSAADTFVTAMRSGGILEHTVAFYWTAEAECAYVGGLLHVYRNGARIASVNFSASAQHLEEYVLDEEYQLSGGFVSGKITYFNSDASMEGTPPPLGNAVLVQPWA